MKYSVFGNFKLVFSTQHCFRSILEGSDGQEGHGQPQQEALGRTGKTTAGTISSKGMECDREDEMKADDGEKPDEPAEGNGEDRKNGGGQGEREAFLACTRRNHETMNLFLEEVTRQGLHYTLVYQATLDADTALFVYNEMHLPIKIFKITLPQDQGTVLEDAAAGDTDAL